MALTDEGIARPMASPYIETNPHYFIHRLPNETLEAIFVQYARDYFHEHSARPISTTPSWVGVSYVSRHWRHVALDCATLWAHFFVASPRWTEELLARSKRALLKVALRTHNQDQERRGFYFLAQVKDHVERIQDLHLDLPVDLQHPFLSKLASRAGRLRHLSITFSRDHSHGSSLHFDGNTPALRKLHLEHCPVSLPSLKLDDLTELVLRYVPIQFQQDITEFLATLSCVQNLRCLSLRNAVTSATGFLSSAGFRNFQKINLPYLSQLFIFDHLSIAIALMSCINIPLEAEIMLGPDFSHEHTSSLDEYAPLYALLKERYNVPPDQVPSISTIRSVVIENSEAPLGCAQVTFRTAECDPDRCNASGDRLDPLCSAPLQILLADRQPAADRQHILSRICSSMPLSQVRNVQVRSPPLSAVFWKDALEQLPELRYLELSKGYMPDLTSQVRVSLAPRNLAENDDERPDRVGDRILAPALEQLALHDITFPAAVNSTVPFEGADFKSLCDALSTRKESRGRLTLTRCIECGSDGRLKIVDLEGRWGDGRFYTVFRKEKNYYEDTAEDDYDYDEEEDEEEDEDDYSDYWEEREEEEEEEEEEKVEELVSEDGTYDENGKVVEDHDDCENDAHDGEEVEAQEDQDERRNDACGEEEAEAEGGHDDYENDSEEAPEEGHQDDEYSDEFEVAEEVECDSGGCEDYNDYYDDDVYDSD